MRQLGGGLGNEVLKSPQAIPELHFSWSEPKVKLPTQLFDIDKIRRNHFLTDSI